MRPTLRLLEGAASGFLREDGTQVQVRRRVAFAVSKMILPGDPIVVERRRTRTPIFIGLGAMKITRPGDPVMLDITRGIGAPELDLP